jgi:imidazolonepropionase-like amidohydrolase
MGEIMGWATINGARALQINHWAGSFEKDKEPGIVWINNISEKQLSQASSSKRIL